MSGSVSAMTSVPSGSIVDSCDAASWTTSRPSSLFSGCSKSSPSVPSPRRGRGVLRDRQEAESGCRASRSGVGSRISVVEPLQAEATRPTSSRVRNRRITGCTNGRGRPCGRLGLGLGLWWGSASREASSAGCTCARPFEDLLRPLWWRHLPPGVPQHNQI